MRRRFTLPSARLAQTPLATPPDGLKIPVLVSDLDLEASLWLKIRLAPMCPWIGTLSLAFVGPPAIKMQLAPYGRVRLMRIPILQVRCLACCCGCCCCCCCCCCLLWVLG